MARIRTIKPEFFTSEDVVELSAMARLFFISLWCEADREGRLRWKPKTLKLRYFPADECDIFALAKELTDQRMVILYEANGLQYAEIPSFSKHQVINNRESESVIPAPNATPHVDDASTTRDDACPTRAHASSLEGKGREGNTIDASGTRGANGSRFVPPTLEELTEYVKENGLHLDPEEFIHFYGSKGWMVGKNKMKSWKQAASGWSSRNKKSQPQPKERPWR